LARRNVVALRVEALHERLLVGGAQSGRSQRWRGDWRSGSDWRREPNWSPYGSGAGAGSGSMYGGSGSSQQYGSGSSSGAGPRNEYFGSRGDFGGASGGYGSGYSGASSGENWGSSIGRSSGIGESGRFGSYAGRGPRNYQRSDERIREEVNERLTDDPRVDASDIEVEVRNGEVTLRGRVEERRDKRTAEEVIENLPGVKDVKNELRVERSGDSSAAAAIAIATRATRGARRAASGTPATRSSATT